MNWKKYKDIFLKKKIDEAHFILGIDLGNATSSIAYYDVNRQTTEIIDISGGYGKPSVPTALQYVSETKEWIFGEYAILNRGNGNDITLISLIEKLGRTEYIEIEGKPVSVTHILGIYLKELISNCKNLNPKAEIAGIVVAVPSYLSEEAKMGLLSVFKAAGYEKSVIDFVSDRECVFRYYFQEPPVKEKTLVLDFGAREFRAGIYQIEPKRGGAKITSLSSLFDKSIGTQVIDDKVNDLITQFYCEENKSNKEKLSAQIMEQILTFSYQHKDLLFQKSFANRPVKLYFNFLYPPFQRAVTNEEINHLIRPVEMKFTEFLKDVFTKTLAGDTKITASDINSVLCTGGGFEMLWVRKKVTELFPDSNVIFYKNAKGVVAEGASIIAAEKLSVIPENKIEIDDLHKLNSDIGVKVTKNKKEKFIPIIERNSFWWQNREPLSFIINEATGEHTDIEFFKRNEQGDMVLLGIAGMHNLPERPAGTTKIRMSMECSSYNYLTVTIKDMGFGEMFPATNFEQQFSFEI